MAARHALLLGLLLLTVGFLAPAVAADGLDGVAAEDYPHCPGILSTPHSCLCPLPDPSPGWVCPFPEP
jgi:hypothetical protein